MDTNAKAYEIRTITEAIVDSQKLPDPVKYSAGEIVIESKQGEETPQLPEDSFSRRRLANGIP